MNIIIFYIWMFCAGYCTCKIDALNKEVNFPWWKRLFFSIGMILCWPVFFGMDIYSWIKYHKTLE